MSLMGTNKNQVPDCTQKERDEILT